MYYFRTPTLNTSKVKLKTIQEYINSIEPYNPIWPIMDNSEYIKGKKLSDDQLLGLKNYLGFLYTSWTDIDKYDSDYLFNFYNSLTFYYNSSGKSEPIYQQTKGWLPSPNVPIIPGGDDGGKTSICTTECIPFCEPGFCSPIRPMPFLPLGYFSEFKHWLTDFSRNDDIMSIGQWVVKYVDENDSSKKDGIFKRFAFDPANLSYGVSMDMWSPFLGRGISFLQGNTLHRSWWYPNSPPGQIQNPLNNSQNFIPMDACTLNSPGLDFGMLSLSSGKKITLKDCLDDSKKLLEYLDMKGPIPSIGWNPTHTDIKKRFNTNGLITSGYKETKSTDPSSSVDYYFIEHSRTDFGTNFAFTGNWIDVFEGAGMFYKYNKTLIASNKCGALLKLMFIIVNNKETLNLQYALLRKIIGVDYISGVNPRDHSPKIYNDGKLYSNQLGVTQGMCMGVSMPGNTGRVVLDPLDSESGAQLWKNSYEGDKSSDESMIYLGMIWLLCNSPVHLPCNDTSYFSGTNKSYGYSTNTWSFFLQWSKSKNFNLSVPIELLKSCKQFLIICAMGSGGDPAENYMVNQWQNTTVFDYLMFTLGVSLGYDLIQLTLDVTENNMWTRESLAMLIPDDMIDSMYKQIYRDGPHGGSFLVFCEQFGTKYDVNSPIMVNKNYISNPMPFYRNTSITDWVDDIGPIGGINIGQIASFYNYNFASDSDFNTKLFEFYAKNGIITLRNPVDLSLEPSVEESEKIYKQINFFLDQTFDRKITGLNTYEGKNYVSAFDANIPEKKLGQRCFGDWCAFFAKDTMTQAWARGAEGFPF